MLYLKIILIFCIIIKISMCPVGKYLDGERCLNCTYDCEECEGPLPEHCNQFISESHSTASINLLKTQKTKPEISDNFNSENDNPIIYERVIIFVLLAFTGIGLLIIVCRCICINFKFTRIRKSKKFYDATFDEKINEPSNCYDEKPNEPFNCYRDTLERHNLKENKYCEVTQVIEEIPNEIYQKTFPSKNIHEGNLLFDQKVEIAGGSFGTIYKCPYVEEGIYIYVAVKIAKLDNQDARREREALSQLYHLHVVKLITINMKEGLGLVMPYRQSNLKKFFANENEKITFEHQIRYCMQIADAFRYIAYKKIVHNDLKSSNILVVDISHVEVCDFGLAEIMGNGKRTIGTITHTAMELLSRKGFSQEKTDVWSYGVTIWEIFNRCQKNPYDDEIIKATNSQNITESMILTYLDKGSRLIPPEKTKMLPKLETVMFECWLKFAHDRPTFNDLFIVFMNALPECQGWEPKVFERPSFNDLFEEFTSALPECQGVIRARKTTDTGIF